MFFDVNVLFVSLPCGFSPVHKGSGISPLVEEEKESQPHRQSCCCHRFGDGLPRLVLLGFPREAGQFVGSLLHCFPQGGQPCQGERPVESFLVGSTEKAARCRCSTACGRCSFASLSPHYFSRQRVCCKLSSKHLATHLLHRLRHQGGNRHTSSSEAVPVAGVLRVCSLWCCFLDSLFLLF